MEGARQLSILPGRGIPELAAKLQEIKASGVQLSSIAEEARVNRSYLSTLVNHGTAAIGPEPQAALWAWIDRWDAQRESGMETAPAARPAGYKTALTIFPTEDYMAAIGWCKMVADHRKIGIMVGMPGTGKTTIAKALLDILPRAVYVEAWQSMRLGDLLDEIATGLGIVLRGNATRKTRDLIGALAERNITIIIDEAENLKKRNVEKLDVLRKIHDNTGVSLLLVGTPSFRHVLNDASATQLSRRMFMFDLNGCKKQEVRRELERYNIDADAADALAEIAADTDHGGMGSYALMMELCLDAAAGGRITMDMLRDARQYKPGLRKG